MSWTEIIAGIIGGVVVLLIVSTVFLRGPNSSGDG